MQAKAVAQALQVSCCTTAATTAADSRAQQQWPKLNPIFVQISATGDHNTTTAKHRIQNAPLAIRNVDFTGALDEALYKGEIDVAVHSLKDILPDHRWRHCESFQIIYPLPREDPCDVLIGPYQTIDEMPSGTKIGTSSIRRQAQLLSICRGGSSNNNKDIQVVNVRGNVEARLEALRMGTVDALVLAKAGMNRLNLVDQEHCFDISPNQMLPGLGQGIIAAVVCRTNGSNVKSITWEENLDASIAASAERAFLNTVDKLALRPWAGRPPLAGLMQRVTDDKGDNSGSNKWVFQGLLAKPDGSQVLHASSEPTDVFTKEQAVNIGTSVGLNILHKAGSNFLVDPRMTKEGLACLKTDRRSAFSSTLPVERKYC